MVVGKAYVIEKKNLFAQECGQCDVSLMHEYFWYNLCKGKVLWSCLTQRKMPVLEASIGWNSQR